MDLKHEVFLMQYDSQFVLRIVSHYCHIQTFKIKRLLRRVQFKYLFVIVNITTCS